jgi:hypothetical protein
MYSESYFFSITKPWKGISMEIKKPVINIFLNGVEKEFLKEVLAGIEEEGVLYEVYSREEAQAERLAHEAAVQSLLETGIGMSKEYLCVNIAKMPEENPLVKIKSSSRMELRMAGINAARLVKGIPLKLINE